MDPTPDHVASLEQRIAELERRLTAMEAAEASREGAGTDDRAAAGAALQPPPPPSVAAMPAGLPAPQPGSWPTLAPQRPSPAPVPAPVASPSPTLRELEERFAGRALAWIGGVALVAAAVFFLSLAFSRGWITEPMRVVIGLVAGSAALSLGALLLARRSPLVGNVLAGVGLGILSVSLFAATRLYGLVPPEVGLGAALVIAVASAAIAIRFDARSVAVYGLVAALIAPPLVGAGPTVLTLLFLAVTLVGTTAISLLRSWRWLPQIAFLLTVPQLAGWLTGDPDTGYALVALAGFWIVNLVAAAGEEVRLRRDDLRPSSATLVVANAAFLLFGLLVVLDGAQEAWRGAAVAIAALAHIAAGAWFLARRGLGHGFGNLVAATGVALLTVAALLQLGAAVVPVAWAAEAVALAWLAARRLHRWSAVGAVILGGLAVGHLLVVEYPLAEAGLPAGLNDGGTPLHASLLTLGALLTAFALAAIAVPARSVRSVLAGTGTFVLAYALTFEATGPELVTMLVLAALVALLLDGLIDAGGTEARLARVDARLRTTWFASGTAPVPGLMAIVLLFTTELPAEALGTTMVAFLNPGFLSLFVVLVGLLLAGVIVGARWVRSILAGTGLLLLAWGLAFQLTAVPFVIAVAVMLPAGVAFVAALARLPEPEPPTPPLRPIPELEPTAAIGGALAWLVGLWTAVIAVALPNRLWVDVDGRVPLQAGWPLAFVALAGAALVAARLLTPWAQRLRPWLDAAAGVVALYAISVAVVDVFQRQVGGAVAGEELAKQAQVAMTVCWTAIGAVALAAGFARGRARWRHAGLLLLGLATAKVVLVDLAALDVAYRAVVLAGLGLLLLASAFVVSRARGPRDEPAGGAVGEP